MKRAHFLAVTATLILAACSDSAGPSGETNIAGTYTLRTVNRQNLPFLLMLTASLGTTYKLEMVSRALTMTGSGNAGTYSDQAALQESNRGRVTTRMESSAGTWTRTNNAIVFRDNADGSTIEGSLSSGTVTFVEYGISFVFRK